MRIFDDADDVFSTLRLPASDAELHNESQIVELMVNAHPSSKGSLMTITSTRFASRRARVGALIAAGVIGFGGVAAASPGGFDPLGLDPDESPVVVEETVPDTTVVEDTIPDDTMAEDTIPEDTIAEEPSLEATASKASAEDGEETTLVEPDETPMFVDNPETAFNEEMCLPGNHGKTVSAVARGEAPFENVDVRDAAQSDCGKKDLEKVDSEEVDGEEVDGEEVDGEEAERSDATQSPTPKAGEDSQKKNNGKNKGGESDTSGKPKAPGNSGGKGKNGK